MEDWYIQLFLQPLFDLEAPGGSDVLQVYSTEARGYVLYGGYDLFGVRSIEADGVGIYVREFLEEHSLALHYRHRRLGSHVPESKDRRSVGDDRDGVALYGEV